MSDNSQPSNSDPRTTVVQTKEGPSGAGWAGVGVLGLALAVAAVFWGSLYQSAQLNKELTNVKHELMESQHQIGDLQAQLGTTAADTKRQVSETITKLNEQLEQTRKESRTTAIRAQSAVKQQTGKAMTALAEKNSQLAEQLDQLKKDSTAKSSEVDQTLSGIKGDVGDVKTEVASAKADIDNTKTDLRRAMGDMGVMSGLIATNSSELGELRRLGERNYVEFTLPKNGTPQKVGDIQMALKKTDTKRNRFTFDVLADDKKVEKRDKTINEPVQFYLSSMRLPYEVVVNSVTKDGVKGYLAIPKTKKLMALR